MFCPVHGVPYEVERFYEIAACPLLLQAFLVLPFESCVKSMLKTTPRMRREKGILHRFFKFGNALCQDLALLQKLLREIFIIRILR